MYVCICNAVTERAIVRAASEGVHSIEELTARTGCAGTCGCCRELAIQVLDDALVQLMHPVAA